MLMGCWSVIEIDQNMLFKLTWDNIENYKQFNYLTKKRQLHIPEIKKKSKS
jgi:hypothetical protein